MKRGQALEKVKRVYSFWGRFPYLYAAQDILTFMGRAAYIRKKAVDKLHLARGGNALEVACGSGRNLKYLVDAVGTKGRVVGFDYSREMLNAAKDLCIKNSWKNVSFVQGDAAELKLRGNFDGVLSVLGISAVPEWEKALARCNAILRPGGRLVVCDARLFRGRLIFLNPLVKAVYSRLAAWDPSKDIPAKMREIFGNVKTEESNLGTFFIAVSVKERKGRAKGNSQRI